MPGEGVAGGAVGRVAGVTRMRVDRGRYPGLIAVVAALAAAAAAEDSAVGTALPERSVRWHAA